MKSRASIAGLARAQPATLSILLALIVIGLISSLHYAHRQSLVMAAQRVENLRQARIELAKGFLHLSLADQADAPFSRENGIALLQQAVLSFQRMLDESSALPAAEAAAFRQGATRFSRLLDEAGQADAIASHRAVALRIAFNDLELRADRLDQAVRADIAVEVARHARLFAYVLAGSTLALLSIIAIVAFAALRQQRSQALQKRTDAALRNSESRFEATFEQAAVGIALLAPDGHWLRVNRKLCAIVGYSPAELLARTFQDITHPDDLNADLDQVRRMLAREIDSYALEKRYLRKDGGLVWINLTVALVWKSDGTPDYFISVVEDISARKAAEQALTDSETNLREAKRLAGLGHWKWDIARDRHFWSAEIYAIYGRDPNQPPAVYPEVQKYFTPESWARLAATVEQGLAAGMPYECEAEVVRPDGEHRWIAARGEAVRDAAGTIIELRGTVQDITARKAAEAALRDSERRFRRLFQEAPLPLCYVDKNGLLADRNQRFDLTFGYSHEELRSLDDWWPLAYPDPAYRASVLETWNAAVADAVAAHRDIEPIEYRVCCKNGDTRSLLISVIAIGEDFLATFFDVTERRQAEEALRELNASLERRVNERTAELTAANRELDSFAYAVSHDLRAPLRAMNGFSQALVEDYGEQLQADAKGYLDQIGIASRRMGELIDGILTLSRSTRGEMSRDAIDLGALARRLLDELARAEPSRQVALEVAPDLTARGDARMIEAALGNLLSNAWKYSARAAAPRIRVYAEQRDGRHWCCIADNGAGFDMAHAERLFKPFQRLHRQEEFPGIGIGLATVRRIVQRHGGRIEAHGEVGKGAVFCFSLAEPVSNKEREA